MDQDNFNAWTPKQVIEFTFIPKIDEAFVKPLYWVEENWELPKIPDLANTRESLDKTRSEPQYSEPSVLDTASTTYFMAVKSMCLFSYKGF